MNPPTEMKKEIPYSASRVYLPLSVTMDDGRTLLTMPSGTHYVRMSDGSLRRARVEKREVPA